MGRGAVAWAGSGPGSFRAWPQGLVAAPREGPMSSPAEPAGLRLGGASGFVAGPVLGVGLGRGPQPEAADEPLVVVPADPGGGDLLQAAEGGDGVAAVVGEGGDRDAEPLIAGPAEMDGPVLAGFLCDRGAAGEGGDRVGAGVGWPGIAPLGEHLGSVDLTRPRQRREDRAVRVLPEVGGSGPVEALHRRRSGP